MYGSILEHVNPEGANLRLVWEDATLTSTNLRGAISEKVDEVPIRSNTIIPNGEVITDEIESPY